MGYRVEYVTVKKVRGLENRVSRLATLTAIFLLLFLFLAGSLWPEGEEVIKRLFFPGDPAVTAAALEKLTGELQAGADVTGSLRNFCLQILKGAELASLR